MSRPASGGRMSEGIRARMAYGIASYSSLEARTAESVPDQVEIPTPIKTEPLAWLLWFPARVNPQAARRPAGSKPKRRLPTLPPNVNERRSMHWRTEAKLISYWRLLSKATASAVPPMQRAHISAIVHRRALGVADESGDAERLKPLVDGLVDAGVLSNDTRGQVEYGAVREQRAGADGPGITLIVRETTTQRTSATDEQRGE